MLPGKFGQSECLRPCIHFVFLPVTFPTPRVSELAAAVCGFPDAPTSRHWAYNLARLDFRCARDDIRARRATVGREVRRALLPRPAASRRSETSVVGRFRCKVKRQVHPSCPSTGPTPHDCPTRRTPAWPRPAGRPSPRTAGGRWAGGGTGRAAGASAGATSRARRRSTCSASSGGGGGRSSPARSSGWASATRCSDGPCRSTRARRGSTCRRPAPGSWATRG